MATPAQTAQAAPDPITKALSGLPLDQKTKADLWEQFHGLRERKTRQQYSGEMLQKIIQPLSLDDEQKAGLWQSVHDWLPTDYPDEGPPQVETGSDQTPPSHEFSKSLLGIAGNTAEDMAFPTAGAAAAAPLGPLGMAAGAGLGELAKEGFRSLTGRGDLNPQTATGEVINLGLAAGGGALQGVAKGIKVIPQVDKNVVQAADEFGIPLSPGQKYGGGYRYIEAFLRKAAGSQEVMHEKFGKPTSDALISAMDDVIDTASHGRFAGQAAAGKFLDEAIQQAYLTAGRDYSDALAAIGAKGADRLPLDTTGALQSKARELLKSFARTDDYQSVNNPAREKMLNELRDFAQGMKKVDTGLVDEAGKPITYEVPKRLTWADARKLKQDLDSQINWDDMKSMQEPLSELRHTLNTEMQATLGNTPEAAAFKQASDNYSKVKDLLDRNIIKRLMENDRPELAARRLLQGGAGQSNMVQLRDILSRSPQGAKAIGVLRGAVLDQMLSKAMDNTAPEASVIGTRLLDQWNRMGENARRVIFSDPAQEARIDRFMRIAAYVAPKETAGFNMATMTQTGAFGASLYAAGRAILQLRPVGAMVALAESAAVYLTPKALAHMLANPTATELLVKAMTTRAGAKGAGYLASQIAYQASKFYEEKKHDSGDVPQEQSK